METRKPRIFVNGGEVENTLNNPNIGTMIEPNKASDRWASDTEHQEIMTAFPSLTNDPVNRYVYICRNPGTEPAP